MARIFIDGFESGSVGAWDTDGGVAINNSLSGRTGNYCGNFSQTDYLRKTVPDKNEYYVAFKYQAYTGSGANSLFQVWEGGIQHINITLSLSSFILNLYRYSSLISSSSLTISLDIWYLIEAYIKISDSSGRFTLKVNGTTFIDFTGDTQNAGTGIINAFQFGSTVVGYQSGAYAYYDDIVIDDANWIGNTKIQALVPTGAGATTGWTPSTGSNYAAVDETPASDTDYVKTNSGQTDTYVMGNLTGSIASIKSVAVQSRNWREGNGNYNRGQHIVRPASTDRLAAVKTNVFPITATSFQSIWELNPEDSAAWEEADVNGMEAGIKAVEA